MACFFRHLSFASRDAVVLQPMDLVVNAPLKAAVRRHLCAEVHDYFNNWRDKRVWAVVKGEPLPAFNPPPFSGESVMIAIMEACRTSLATDAFRKTLAAVFVTVGIARNNTGAVGSAVFKEYVPEATQQDALMLFPPLESPSGDLQPDHAASVRTPTGGSALEHQYSLAQLVAGVTALESQPDDLDFDELDVGLDGIDEFAADEVDSDGDGQFTAIASGGAGSSSESELAPSGPGTDSPHHDDGMIML